MAPLQNPFGQQREQQAGHAHSYDAGQKRNLDLKTITERNKDQRRDGVAGQIDRKEKARLNTAKSPLCLNKWDGGDILRKSQAGQEKQEAPAEAMRG